MVFADTEKSTETEHSVSDFPAGLVDHDTFNLTYLLVLGTVDSFPRTLYRWRSDGQFRDRYPWTCSFAQACEELTNPPTNRSLAVWHSLSQHHQAD